MHSCGNTAVDGYKRLKLAQLLGQRDVFLSHLEARDHREDLAGVGQVGLLVVPGVRRPRRVEHPAPHVGRYHLPRLAA
jgi:hypothetical protein